MTRKAIDVKKGVELVTTIAMLGLIEDIVELLIADPDHNKIAVITNTTFVLFKLLYFFL